MNRSPSASSAKNAAALFRLSVCVWPRHEEDHERGREQEAGRVEPEGARRPERRHEHASERRTHERGALLNSRANAAGALHRHPGRLDDIGEERRARRGARRVQKCADEDERHELPELEPDRRVQQRDRGDGPGAGEIRDHARRPEPEPVDDDSAEERASTIGRKLKNTARPVSAALPVVVRTNHGIATCATALPDKEIASAP